MKKPERIPDNLSPEDYNYAFPAGANWMWDKWEKYHKWFVKEKCIVKENLLSAEEIRDDIYDMLMKRKDWQSIDFVRDGFDPYLFTERISVDLAQALAKRIRKEDK